MSWMELLKECDAFLGEHEYIFTPLAIIVSIFIFVKETKNSRQSMESETFRKLFEEIVTSDLPKCINTDLFDISILEDTLTTLMVNAEYCKYMYPYFYKEVVYRKQQIDRILIDSEGEKYKLYFSSAKYERLIKKRTAGIIRLVSSFSRGKRMRCIILRFPPVAFIRDSIDMLRRHRWDKIKNTYSLNDKISFEYNAIQKDEAKNKKYSFDMELKDTDKDKSIIGADAITKSGLFHFGLWRVFATKNKNVKIKKLDGNKLRIDCLKPKKSLVKKKDKFSYMIGERESGGKKRIYIVVRVKNKTTKRKIMYKEIRINLEDNKVEEIEPKALDNQETVKAKQDTLI